MEIHVQARPPSSEEGERKADFVWRGVTIWTVQAEAAMKSGARHPPVGIVEFMRGFKG
jgi:hypothetical protein